MLTIARRRVRSSVWQVDEHDFCINRNSFVDLGVYQLVRYPGGAVVFNCDSQRSWAHGCFASRSSRCGLFDALLASSPFLFDIGDMCRGAAWAFVV